MRGSKILPFAILGASALVILLLYLARRTPEERDQQNSAPLVRVAIAEPTPYRFSVTAHGSVSPRTESDLISQVSGEVVWISPALAAGGFFESGDILVRIDPADYRVDRETARAAVARAKSEHDRAEKERNRQLRLAKSSVASQSRIDDAENAFRIAEASLLESRARLERAARDLTRTKLIAPYRGRVRNEQVDVGQFVTRGTPIAKLYAVDYAEIRLPVPDRELAFLDVPLVPQMQTADSRPESNSSVTLTAEFAGREQRWQGSLVRTEAELDPRSRMVHLVARVADPYGLSSGLSNRTSEDTTVQGARTDDRPSAPLAVGLFVEAVISGHKIDRAFVLPRDALRDGSRVYVIDAENRLQFRDVEVLRTERENVILGQGLASGDRICVSPLQAAINGMSVRVFGQDSEQADDSDAAGLADRSLAAPAVLQ